MDTPVSRVNSTGGSSSRPITINGITNFGSKEVSTYFCGDGPGHGTYRNRSRSRSPGRFERAGFNDRVNRIASSDHRTDMSSRTRRFTHNAPMTNCVNNDLIGEQRVMAHSSYQMSVSERRGTTFLGANIEAAASGQCLRSSEQNSNLTDILARLLDEIKKRPDLYAALSDTNALVTLQSFVSCYAGRDAQAASSRHLDLVTASLVLISVKHHEVALFSKETTDIKSQRFFKGELTDFVKKFLRPSWHNKEIDREAFKGIVKKVVEMEMSSFQSICIPQTQKDINDYLYAAGPCISMLVQEFLFGIQERKS